MRPYHRLIFVLAASIMSSRCQEEKFADTLPVEFPQIVLLKFTLTETEAGKKLWTLGAERAHVYDETINVDSVRIKFFDDQQHDHATLTGLSGTLNTKTRNIIVRDHVVLLTGDSIRLDTDSLFWQNDSQKILTDSYVRIVKPDGTVIEGTGLQTAPDLKRIEIIGTVAGASPIEFPKIK